MNEPSNLIDERHDESARMRFVAGLHEPSNKARRNVYRE